MERLPIALAIIVLSATVCFAGGPNYGPNYTPQNSDKEFQNVYHDLQYPKISTGTAQNFYITAGSATAFNIGTSTITLLTASTGTIKSFMVLGTATNDDAPVGRPGEYVTSNSGAVTAAATGQYQDTTTISLTPGDWDISGFWNFFGPASTTGIEFGLSIGTAGNNFTDNVNGENRGDITAALGSTVGAISSWRKSLSSTTVVKLKTQYNFTGTAPTTSGRISARRMR